MSAYWPYESVTPPCSGGPQLGTVDLLKYLMLKFPGTTSMGIYNCRESSGGGGFSVHSDGRAIDLRIPLVFGQANTALGDPIVVFLDEFAYEFGIHGQIWNEVRYDFTTPRGREYTGPHPHHDHNHIEQRTTHATTLRFKDYVEIAGTPIGGEMIPYLAYCEIGDKGIHVGALQIMLSVMKFYTGTIDNDYGPATSAAVLAMRKSRGSSATSGDAFSQSAHEQLLAAHAIWAVGAAAGGVTLEQVTDEIAKHAKLKSSSSVHPHTHDEGSTGPAK